MRSRRSPILGCLLLATGAVAAPPTAQTPVPDALPNPVTLPQAVQEALQKNLNLLASRFDLSIADARLITARLRPNPILTVGNDYTDVFRENFTLANGKGPPEATARVDYPIERGRKRENRIIVAENQRSVAQFQLLNTTRQLVFDVSSAFIDVQAAKENVALARDNLESFNRVVQVNTARVRAGDLAQVEYMRSQVATFQYQNALRQAELQLRTAQNKLRNLLGRPLSAGAVDVTGELRRDTQPLELPTIQTQALQLRPDLQALNRDQARSLADLRLQIALGRVDYSIGVQYHGQYGPVRGDSLGFFFVAPLPIYSRNQGEIARAQREGQQIQAKIRALQNDINTEVQAAFDTYQTSQTQLDYIEKDLLGKAKQVRDITEYSYRRGEASFVEFLDAQRAYNDSVQAYNSARADFARSLYQIESVTGKAVNP